MKALKIRESLFGDAHLEVGMSKHSQARLYTLQERLDTARDHFQQALRTFEAPVLLAWASEDRLFRPEFAERLAAVFPRSRLEWIGDSYSFVSEDQPEALVELIRKFLA